VSREDVPVPAELKARILEILGGGQLMTLATLREDGWPQATTVNYLHRGVTLYCLVGRESQKLVNIRRDSRVSVAIAGPRGAERSVSGLSMAARAAEVAEPHLIEELNHLIWGRREVEAFAPHPSSPSVAVLEIRPEIISLVNYAHPPGQQVLLRVVEDFEVKPI
jgi:general stress protein 26